MDRSLGYDNVFMNKEDNASFRDNECSLNNENEENQETIENEEKEETSEHQKEAAIVFMQDIPENSVVSNFIDRASSDGLKNRVGRDVKEDLGAFAVVKRPPSSENSNLRLNFSEIFHEQEMAADMTFAACENSIRGNIFTNLNTTTETGVPGSELQQAIQNSDLPISSELSSSLFFSGLQSNYAEIASISGPSFSSENILKSLEDFTNRFTGEMRLTKEVVLSAEEDSSTSGDDSNIENEDERKNTVTINFNSEGSVKIPVRKNEDYPIDDGISAEEKKLDRNSIFAASVDFNSSNGNNGDAGFGTTSVVAASSADTFSPGLGTTSGVAPSSAHSFSPGLGTTSVVAASSVHTFSPSCSNDSSNGEKKGLNSETEALFVRPKTPTRTTRESEVFIDSSFTRVKFVRTSPGDMGIISIKYNDEEHICEICREKFPSFSHIKNHLHPYEGKEKSTDSAQCKKRRLGDHIKPESSTSNNSTSGSLNRTLRSEECPEGHSSSQHKPKKEDEHLCLSMANYFYCAHCGKAYTVKQSLQYHIWTQHNPEEINPFRCDHCKKDFSNENSLRCHIRINHHNAKNQF